MPGRDPSLVIADFIKIINERKLFFSDQFFIFLVLKIYRITFLYIKKKLISNIEKYNKIFYFANFSFKFMYFKIFKKFFNTRNSKYYKNQTI